jgi:hypothetical protein
VWIRIRIPGSVPLTMDPDPTPVFNDFKNAKKKLVFIFFSYNLPTGTHLQSKKFNFLLNFYVKILFFRHYVHTFMRKGKDPDPEPDPYL